MEKARIMIAGCGFVGLVSAAAFASKGFKVIATTIKEDEAEMINKGISPFYEEDLDEILTKAIELKNLRVVTDNREAVFNSDITFISVGTPMREDDSIDLSYIDEVSKQIGKALAEKEEYHVIVDRSTVVPGTTRNIIGKNAEEQSGKKMGADFGLCMQPEFLREGSSVYDTFHPNRLIMGQLDERSGDFLEQVWRDFYGDPFPPYERMNIESAEMVKYANNCFLSTKISFANEFANFAELIPNVDVTEVMKGIGMDDRVNPKFLGAGVGFGGSCFHKDVSAIKEWARDKGFDSYILKAVLNLNDYQAIHTVDIAQQLVPDFKGKKITLLGLSFKPGTDDMREAPSVRIVHELKKRGAENIVGYDPKSNEAAEVVLGEKINYVTSAKEALQDAELAILVTEWDEFKELSAEDFLNTMKVPNLVDGRRIYPYAEFNSKLNLRVIGRK